jgi:hypothetical protein
MITLRRADWQSCQCSCAVTGDVLDHRGNADPFSLQCNNFRSDARATKITAQSPAADLGGLGTPNASYNRLGAK